MKTPNLNLHELMRRLGKRGGQEQPELSDLIVPVSIVSDHRELVPPLLAPSALVGCNFQTTAGRFACFELVSMAPGGTLIIECLAATQAAGGGQIKFNILTPGSFAAIGFPVAGISTNFAPDPVVATSRFGENAASVMPFNTLASMFIQQASTFRIPAPMYVKPGHQFFLENSSASATLSVAMIYLEFPAIPSHPDKLNP